VQLQIIESSEELERFILKTFGRIIDKYQLKLEVIGPYQFFLIQKVYALYIASDREMFGVDYVENYSRAGYQCFSFLHLKNRRKMEFDLMEFEPDRENYANYRSLKILAYQLENYCDDLLSGDKNWIKRDKLNLLQVAPWFFNYLKGKIEKTGS
jgi:hypothetical protein